MPVFRQGDFVRRSAYPHVGSCCCPKCEACYGFGETVLCGNHPGVASYPAPMCIRWLLWESATWSESANMFNPIGLTATNPTHSFAIGDWENPANYRKGFPYEAVCWENLPVLRSAGLDSDHCIDLSAAYASFVEAGINDLFGVGKLCEGAPFAISLVVQTWRWRHWDWTKTPRHTYYGTSKVEYILTVMTKSLVEEDDE